MDEPRTIATLETEYGKIKVSVKKSDLTIFELWEDVIEPLLVASGYAQETINNLFEEK